MPLLDRRGALRGLGALAAAPVLGACGHDGAGTSGGADAGVTMPPPTTFDPVATCALTPTDPASEGPFFIHEDEVMNDPSIFRSDMRDGADGVELRINLRMLDSSQSCMAAIPGVQVYVWHTNALGFYSGFNGQNPDMRYTGGAERTPDNLERFCRGAQATGADGVVSFTSIFPGWYNGRAIHIHFLALRPGSGPLTTSYRGQPYHVFTTQLYFEEQLSRSVHENNAPYTSRASGAAYDTYVKPETSVRPTVTRSGAVVIASLDILTDPATSRR
jgi:protocatechuate 3,4-dioxygenase beta subunit